MLTQPIKPLPLSAALLERYRISSRQQSRPSLVGGHLMRRKGQSLEFREYVPYMPGDDIRHVDWRASARYGSRNDLLVRKFMAEEHLTIVISLDTRETMRLPLACSKIQVALWLAQAIAWVALRSDDRVILHRLFGKASQSVVELRGSAGLTRIPQALRRVGAYEGAMETVNLNVLRPYLPPTAVWLILTDFYFELDQQAQRLARKIASAQDGLRWVILLDLDSWPYEKFILGEGARRIEGPGTEVQTEFDITQESIQQVEQEIEAHKRNFYKLIRRRGYDKNAWKWPASESLEAEQFFKDNFLADPILRRLFMRET